MGLYLKQLKASYLKIDQQFVRDVEHEPANESVVRAVVSLARAFGLETIAEGAETPGTIAEGAETPGTIALLAELGVDHAQGSAIGPPRPVADAFGTG